MQELLTLPCLGRDMELGTLYDCRTETIVPGSLWPTKKIKENSRTPQRPTKTSGFTFLTENNFSTNMHALDVAGSLKMSLFCGLVKVSGAATYLNNYQNSVNQARVILKYTCRSGWEKLRDIDQMAPHNQKIFQDQHATHVVTEVEYGGDAVFIFTREIQKGEDRHNLEIGLKAAIKNYVPVEQGQATVRATASKNETNEASKFSCTFWGDTDTKTVTLNFEEALELCRHVPQMIMENKSDTSVLYGVPKTVKLYPLSLLDPKAATVAFTVSSGIMDSIEHYCEQIHARLAEVTALESIKAYNTFKDFETRIKTFKHALEKFFERFQDELKKLLPQIRRAELKESALANFMEKIKLSPYNTEELKKWIELRKRELNCFESYLESFENSNVEKAFDAGDLEKYVHNTKFTRILAMVFGNIVSSEFSKCATTYLQAMTEFSLASTDLKYQNSDLNCTWLENEEIKSFLDKQINLFCDFAKSNKNINENLKYIAVLRGEAKPGTVLLYSSGKEGRIFPIPSAPEIETIYKKVPSFYQWVIKWKPPTTGVESVTRYKIYYRRQPRSVSRSWLTWIATTGELVGDPVIKGVRGGDTFLPMDSTWKSVCTNGTETEYEMYVMISTSYEYQFKVAALTDAGETADSPMRFFYWN